MGKLIGMPDYTPEQKSAAFDALWEKNAGLIKGC